MLNYHYHTKKTVQSIGIALLIILSSFAGFFAIITPVKAAEWDLIINATNYPDTNGILTIENTIPDPQDGDIIVESTGTLILRNSVLSFTNDGTHPHSLIVDGGTLILDRATITTHLNQIDSQPRLNINIQNGATVNSSNRSTLEFPGNITITGATTKVVLRDTDITAHPDVSTYFTIPTKLDLVNDGPIINIDNATFEMYDSAILNLPEYPIVGAKWADNLTLSGNANFTAVNSYISADFDNSQNTHNSIVLKDQASAYLYGCTFDDPTTPPGEVSAIAAESGNSAVLKPMANVTTEDTTDGNVSELWFEDDGKTYHVGAGESMSVGSFDTSALSTDPTSVTLVLKFSASMTYNGALSITYAIDPNPYNSLNIFPLAGDTNRGENASLFALGVDTLAEISNLKINFTHNGDSGNVQFDVMYLVVEVGPQAYIYRWADFRLADEYGVPILGSELSARFTGSLALEGKNAYYYAPVGILSDPPSYVLSYMGKNASNYLIADSNGKVLVPYLTDIINGNSTSNSLFVGRYNFAATNGSDSTTVRNAFNLYPAMNSTSTSLSMILRIEGAWAPNGSWDVSKYIVVPENIILSGGSYIHGGDIIVRPGGLLVLDNLSFSINPSESSSKIIIHNGGTLQISSSSLDSNLPVSVQVKDGGTLIIDNSSLSNYLSTDVEGAATIQISSSVISGQFSTAWDSSAVLDIEDTILVQPLVIDGYSYADILNVSAPSLDLSGHATVNLSRWIIVTILDGTGYPLPNATVSAIHPQEDTLNTSGITGDNGTVKLKALASVLSASEPERKLGNYNVSSIFTFDSTDYYSDFTMVALASYSEPLLQNNPLVGLSIPDALPDLDPPINLDPDPPLSYGSCTVNTTITNNGVVDARDVLVYFYDSDDNVTFSISEKFAEETIPLIPANSSVEINATWSVSYDAGTVRYIGIEIDPFNDIPEWNESDNSNWTRVDIIGSPDLVIGPSGIWSGENPSDPTPIVEGLPADLRAQILNEGDDDTPGSFIVYFYYDGMNLIGTDTVTEILGPDNTTIANVTWASPPAVSPVTITVTFNPGGESFMERDLENNDASTEMIINTQPDLYIDNIDCEGIIEDWDGAPSSYESTFIVLVRNSGDAPIEATVSSPVMVALYEGAEATTNTMLVHADITTTISKTSPASVELVYTLPAIDNETEDYTFWVVVNPNASQGGSDDREYESSYANNIDSYTLTVFDSRPDIAVFPEDIVLLVDGQEVENVSYADQLEIRVTVHNHGFLPAEDFSVYAGIAGKEGTITASINRSIGTSYISVNGSISPDVTSSNQTTLSYIVTVPYSGEYYIRIAIDDVEFKIDDKNRSNNNASRGFNLSYIQPQITINNPLAEAEVHAGDMLVVTGIVEYPDDTPMANMVVEVVIKTVDTDENVSDTITYVTGTSGVFSVEIDIPTDLSGRYNVVAKVGENRASVIIEVVEEGFALWIWALMIIVIAAAAIAIISLFIFRRGIGKLVECGECGALIPESARKCPKCGVEFEEDMVKCSECGAWIPSSSLECPNCHVRFGAPPEEEKDFEEKMKEQYEKTVLSKYRDLAKAELGVEYSEETFKSWWAANPAYISFEDWLAKEEEKREAATPIICKTCGTPNARGSAICHKCGSPLPVEEKAPPKQPPIGPPEEVIVEKRVIRKPIDRKIVPKKVIKKPIDEERQGGENQ